MEGSLDINGGFYYDIANYTLHPKYVAAWFVYDVAVIRVKRQIRPSQLPHTATRTIDIYGDDEVPEGELIEMYGWGRVSVC